MHGSVPAGDIDVLRHAGHRRLPDSSACSVWAGNGQIPWKTLWRESAARVSGGREIDFTMWPLPRPHERAPRGSVHAERCPGEGEGDTSGGDVVHSVRSGPHRSRDSLPPGLTPPSNTEAFLIVPSSADGWRQPSSVPPTSLRRRTVHEARITRVPGMGRRPRQADHRPSRARRAEAPVGGGSSARRRRSCDVAREKTFTQDASRSRRRRRIHRGRYTRGHPRGRRAGPRSRAMPPLGRLLRPPPQPQDVRGLRRRPTGGPSRSIGARRRHTLPRGLLARTRRHPGRAAHRGTRRREGVDGTVRHDPREPRSGHGGWRDTRAHTACSRQPGSSEDLIEAHGVEKRAVAAVQARRRRDQERGGQSQVGDRVQWGRYAERHILPRRRHRRLHERNVPGQRRPGPLHV